MGKIQDTAEIVTILMDLSGNMDSISAGDVSETMLITWALSK